MKNITLTILLLLAMLGANAQDFILDNEGFYGSVEFSGFSMGTTVTGDLVNFSDQTSNMYSLNDLDTTCLIADQAGVWWKVDSIETTTLFSATVRLVRVKNNGTSPFGVGYIGKPTPCGTVPFSTTNSVGISAKLQSEVEKYNAYRIIQCDSINMTSNIVGTGGGSMVLDTVTEVNHIKELTKLVYYDSNGDVELVDNDSTFADGVVVEIIDMDTYVVQTDGFAYIPGHGLTVGEYYESAHSNGDITTNDQSISHFVLKPTSSDWVLIRMYRPDDNNNNNGGNSGSSGGRTYVFNDGNTVDFTVTSDTVVTAEIAGVAGSTINQIVYSNGDGTIRWGDVGSLSDTSIWESRYDGSDTDFTNLKDSTFFIEYSRGIGQTRLNGIGTFDFPSAEMRFTAPNESSERSGALEFYTGHPTVPASTDFASGAISFETGASFGNKFAGAINFTAGSPQDEAGSPGGLSFSSQWYNIHSLRAKAFASDPDPYFVVRNNSANEYLRITSYPSDTSEVKISNSKVIIEDLVQIQTDTFLAVRNDTLGYAIAPQGGDLNQIAIVADYTAFRASSFAAEIEQVYVSDTLLSGQFFRSDQVQVDDGGVFIEDNDGNVWKRDFAGDVIITWYGTVEGDNDANKAVNQVAISAAIDAGRSLGRETLIPAGIYVTNEIGIDEGDFTLKGVGKGKSILKAGAGQCATCALIEVNEFSNPSFIGNMTFKDFSFDGNQPAYVGQVTQERELLNLRRVENVLVLRCEFINGSTDAIDCDYEARGLEILSCTFTNNQRIAIHSYGCVGCRIENNIFTNNNLSTSTVNSAALDVIDVISGQYPDGNGGTTIAKARDVIVKNNVITVDTTLLSGAIAGVGGIVIDDCVNCTVEENNVNGIRFLSGTLGFGIKVGTGCENFVLRDNTLADIDGIAVWVVAVTGDFGNIENTTITQCSIGIKTAAVRMIEGGKIEGATDKGVEIQTQTTLKNVEFLDTRGVSLLVNADSTIIQNCTFKNMLGNAISVDRMAYIINNVFEGETTNHCVNFNNVLSVGTVIKGNTMIGFRRSGIRIPSFVNDANNPVYITDNVIDGRFNSFDTANHDGISLDGFHIVFARNTIKGCRRGFDPANASAVLPTIEFEYNRIKGNTTNIDLNSGTNPTTDFESFLYNSPATY